MTGEAVAKPLQPGTWVRLVGLRERADLNGKEGELQEYSAEEDRWKVWLESGFGKKICAANLEPCNKSSNKFKVGGAVRIVGLVSQPELNGQEGTIIEFDEEKHCWKVRLSDGAGKIVKAMNLQDCRTPSMFALGQRVRVIGLDARPDIDGLKGSIVDFCADQLQWQVKVANDALETLKAGNLAPIVDVASTFSAGQRVRVFGLKARQDLNGQEGKIVSCDADGCCWNVKMADGAGKKLKAGNLQTICLSARANSIIGDRLFKTGPLGFQVQSTQGLSSSHLLSFPSSSRHSFQTALPVGSENIAGVSGAPAFATGQAIRVIGQQTNSELNGHRGLIVDFHDFHEGLGRWKVQMDNGTGRTLVASKWK
jgi:hypothetical protein